MDLINDLKWRGIWNNVTNEEKFIKAIQDGAPVYVGFDPSADSLHLGNFVLMQLLRRFANAGLKPYALIGGATGMIGDPSGKAAERNLLDQTTVLKNKLAIKQQLEKYTGATVIDNLELYEQLSVLDFLRDVGKLINVSTLLEKEIIRNRLSAGISYTEFTYNILQGNDFLQYYQKYGVRVQAGGSDQWGNITTGIEMIRKVVGDHHEAVGFTVSLLTKPDGKKFGKSEKGAVFLDPNKTSPYEMYQFLINQADTEIIKLLKFLTFVSKEEIEILEQATLNEPFKKLAQKKLAEVLVTQIHGEEALTDAQRLSNALFTENVSEMSEKDLDEIFKNFEMAKIEANEINVLDLLIAVKAVDSKRLGRDLIKSNGIMVNGKVIEQEQVTFTKQELLYGKYLIVKKGKRSYFLGSLI